MIHIICSANSLKPISHPRQRRCTCACGADGGGNAGIMHAVYRGGVDNSPKDTVYSMLSNVDLINSLHKQL